MSPGSETRDTILLEARRLFAERGYAGATIGEIARRAGIAEGTIYRHFDSKKELFIACLEPAVDKVYNQLLAEIYGGDDLHSVVRAGLDARLRVIQENLDTFSIMFTEAPRHPELAEMLLERFVLARAEITASALQQFLSMGEVKHPPSVYLGIGITTAIWIILKLRDLVESIRDRSPLPLSTENLLDDLTDLVLYGIAGQPPGGEK